jgi:hypothetical protein
MAKRSAGDPRVLIPELLEALSNAPAHTSPALRQAIQMRSAMSSGTVGSVARVSTDVPSELHELVDKIADRATEVTDEDFAVLSARGYTVDQLYEIVLCAAIGPSHARLKRGMDVLDLAVSQVSQES